VPQRLIERRDPNPVRLLGRGCSGMAGGDGGLERIRPERPPSLSARSSEARPRRMRT
jgi:hypothetical protein